MAQARQAATLLQRHIPEHLRRSRIGELSRGDMVAWIRGLRPARKDGPALFQDRIDIPCTTLRAALRTTGQAVEDALPGLRSEAVTKAREVRQGAAHRNIVLPPQQRAAFFRVAAEVAGEDFATFAAVLDATGVRPGQAARCTVADRRPRKVGARHRAEPLNPPRHAEQARFAEVSRASAALRQAFLQPGQAAARQTWRHVPDQLRPRWPTLGKLMEDSEDDVLACMASPPQHGTRLHSANPPERLNRAAKRRAGVAGIFLPEASIIRLIGAVLPGANDEWQLRHRYMGVEAMGEMPSPPPTDGTPHLPPNAP